MPTKAIRARMLRGATIGAMAGLVISTTGYLISCTPWAVLITVLAGSSYGLRRGTLMASAQGAGLGLFLAALGDLCGRTTVQGVVTIGLFALLGAYAAFTTAPAHDD